MQKLFSDTRLLDSSCRFSYGLSEEIMMENAASALEQEIRLNTKPGDKVLILCGGGNNGADGYALSRRIRLDYEVKVYQCYEPGSKMCILQAERAEKCGINFINIKNFPIGDLRTASVVVDCIFGSGFYGEFEGEQVEQIICAINDINSSCCYKIACDVPTGIRQDGTIAETAFCADTTVTMGALKLSLYSDMAKDYAGVIKCVNLGVTRSLFENSNKENLEAAYLLEEKDLTLPYRKKNLVNKGNFGSAYVACGDKAGAACIAASACFNFGAGLVTIIRPEDDFNNSCLPEASMELITATDFGRKVDCIALGMGLGNDREMASFYIEYLKENPEISCVLDADICYCEDLKNLLFERGNGCVLTPHPKEFSALLKVCGFGEYSVEECINRRPELIEKFCKTFPDAVIIVKGSNPMIGKYTEGAGFKLYVNTFGSPALAKGGSGDVLSGLVCSLLTQGYSPIDSAINASLAHALASRKIQNDYALTPQKLINAVCEL